MIGVLQILLHMSIFISEWSLQHVQQVIQLNPVRRCQGESAMLSSLSMLKIWSVLYWIVVASSQNRS